MWMTVAGWISRPRSTAQRVGKKVIAALGVLRANGRTPAQASELKGGMFEDVSGAAPAPG